MLVVSNNLINLSKAVKVTRCVLRKSHSSEWCGLWFGPSFQRCWSLGAQGPAPSWISEPLCSFQTSLEVSYEQVPYSKQLTLAPQLHHSPSQTWALPGCCCWRGPVCQLCSHCTQLAWRDREKQAILWTAWAFLAKKKKKRSMRRRSKVLAKYGCLIHRTSPATWEVGRKSQCWGRCW